MKSRILTIGYISGKHNDVFPFIRLRGKWLTKVGFNCGDKILVTVDHESLTITKNLKGNQTNGMAETASNNNEQNKTKTGVIS